MSVERTQHPAPVELYCDPWRASFTDGGDGFTLMYRAGGHARDWQWLHRVRSEDIPALRELLDAVEAETRS